MIPLPLQARDTERNTKQLRRESVVPCVLYGNDVEPMNLQGDHNELLRTYAKAGESTIVEIEANGKKVPCLVHSIDFDPVTDRVIHIDFYAVNMKKEIETHVPIHFTGEAPAVGEKGAVLLTIADTVTVRCLPSNLPHALEVSLENLKEFGDSVTVAEITAPENVTIVDEPETTLANVQEPRVEEEPEPTEEGEGSEATEGGEGEKAEEGGESSEGEDKE